MDVISVNGVSYEKASVLAKEFKYTSDYIGQLCRARKVDAQLVGRTWYVNRESLETHRSSRYSKVDQFVDDKTFEYKVKINKSRIDVQPALNKKVAKILNHEQNFAKRIDWKPVKYEYDSSDLIPNLLSERQKINVDLAEAEKIVVRNTSKNIDLISEDLPIVSLSGDINITSADENYDVEKELLERSFPTVKNESEDIVPSHSPDMVVESFTRKEVKDDNFRLESTVSWLFILLLILLNIMTLFVDIELTANREHYETNFNFSYQLVGDFLKKIQ